jgi:hypothetical protein
MRKITLLLAVMAVFWVSSVKAETVKTYQQNETIQLISSSMPSGWSIAGTPIYGTANISSITANSIQMLSGGTAPGGGRGLEVDFPATNTYSNASNIVTLEADWTVTNRVMGSRNAIGFMVDASASTVATPVHIFGLYSCGTGANLYLTNYRSDSIPLTGAGSFNFSSASATASVIEGASYGNYVNRVCISDATGRTTLFAFANNKTYHITAVLNFATKKITSITISGNSNTATLTNGGAGFNFFDQTANNTNIAKISIFNSKASLRGNGGSLSASTNYQTISNLQIYKSINLGTLSTNGAQCVSNGVNLSTTVASATGETLYWQDTNTGTSTTYQDIRNVTTSGDNYLRMLTTNTTAAYNVWSDASSALAATVYPASVGGTAVAVDASVPDASHTVVNLTGNAGTIQWYVSTNGTDYSTVSGGSGATTATYTTPNLTGGTTYYYKALVTSGNCSSDFSTPSSVSAVSSSATVTVGSLSGSGTYGKIANGSTSTSQSFTVEGSQLAGSITIHPPTGFELSSDNISFSSSNIVLTNSGTVTSTTIYARFTPSAVQAYTYTSSNGISISSTNVSTQYLNVTGTGIAAEPSTQTSAAGASSVLQTSMTFGWTKGSGAKSIVLYSTNSDVATAHIPVDGTTYTAGTEIATGYNVLYIGTGNSANLSSLTAATTYYFAVFTFDDGGVAGSENYKTSSPASLTQATLANSNATDYFKSGATGDWSTIATWLSSTDNSSWHIATMIPQSNSTGVLVSAANPVLITSTSLTQAFTMENDATVSVEPGGGTGYGAAYNFTNTIAGSGSALKIKSFTSSSINNNSIGYSPTITNINTLNFEMNVAGAIKGTNWGTCFGAVLPSGTQVNVTSTVGSAGFATLSDGILTNYKVNLGANVRLFKNYNQNSTGGHSNIVVGEITGASTSTIEGGFITARYLDYTIGGANTDATFDGKFKNYVAGDLLEIFKVGSGNWTLTGNSTGFLTGLFTVSAGKVTLNSGAGLGSVPVTVASGATLQGAGSIGGVATISAGATLNGSLNFGSTLSLAGTTNLTVTDFTSNFDVISVTGIITNGGTLNLTVNASAPAVGTSIKLINATGGYSSTFGTKNLPLGYRFDDASGTLYYDGTTVSSNTTLTTIPNNGAVTVSGGLLTIDQNALLSSLTIAPGAKVTLASGRTLAAGTITIQGDVTNGSGTFLDPSGAATVTAVVQQTMLGTSSTIPRGWWYVSSPVSNATADVFIPNGSTNKFGYWNEPTFNYPQINITNNATTALEVGKGYVFNNTGGDAAINFSGTLNTGDKTIYPTRTGTTNGSRGFNLVGNPYPSYLDWNAATKVKVRNTIWYRTWLAGETGGMTFDTYDGTTGTGNGVNGTVSNMIPPMQGFWVKVNADGDNASITFHNNDRAHKGATSNLLRTKASGATLPGIVRLRVSNGLNSDETILVGDENASDAADSYDSPKMKNNNALIPEIYTLAGIEELVINHLNSINANKELTLGFRPGKTGDFSISANELSNLDNDIRVILKDNEQSGEYDLTDGTAYTFNSGVTETTSRFSIVFKSASVTTGQQTLNGNKVLASCNENNQLVIQINGEIGANCQVAVYNSIGQKMISEQLTQSKQVFDTVLVPGVYVVALNKDGQKLIKKVVIN